MQPTVLSVAVPAIRQGREVVLFAEHAAREHGTGFLDAEHLLLAATTLCTGIPRLRAVLDAHGVTPGAVSGALPSLSLPGPGLPIADERVTCTPTAVRLLARAEQLAGPGERVRPHHVLLAVCDGVDDPTLGTAHELLDGLGADVRRFRRALRRAARRA